MVATQIITYLRNNIYLPHLDTLLYFTPDYHNDKLVQRNLFLQPILKPHQIPPIPNNILHHTSYLLPQPPQKYLLNILFQITYLGFNNSPNHYLVPHTALVCLGGGRQSCRL